MKYTHKIITSPNNKFHVSLKNINDCDGKVFFRRKNKIYLIKFHTEDTDSTMNELQEIDYRIFDIFLRNL